MPTSTQPAPAPTVAPAIHRHLPLVYASALRQTANPDLASDITQAVFLILHQKQPTFPNPALLAPWLLRVTRYACLDAQKRARRRTFHETKAATMRPDLQPAPSLPDEHPRGLIDAALDQLPAKDRTALILSILENQSHAQVAAALNITPEAARKRIDRALAKLRKSLIKQGITAASLTSSIALLDKSSHAPAQVLESVHTALQGQVTPNIAAIVEGASTMMSLLKVKAFGAFLAVLLALAATTLLAATPAQTRTPPFPSPVTTRPLAAVPPASLPAPNSIHAAETQPSPPPHMEEIIAQLEQAEGRLQNLQVTSEVLNETWDNAARKWNFVGSCELTGTYAGKPGTKVFIDVQKQVGPWTNGPADFFQQTFAVAYNGQVGQQLEILSGAPENPLLVLRGTITQATPPLMTGLHWCTGRTSSIFGFYEQQGGSLSAFFRKNAKPPVLVEITWKDGNQEILVVKLTAKSNAKTLEIDTSRGYAILSDETTYAQGGSRRTAVKKLQEVATGVFYPMEGESLHFDAGLLVSRSTFKATTVKANDPTLSEDIFTLKWPPGTLVEDTIHKTRFRAADTPQPATGETTTHPALAN